MSTPSSNPCKGFTLDPLRLRPRPLESTSMANNKNKEAKDYYQLNAIISAEEHALMHKKMRAAGMNISELVRSLIRSTEVVERKGDLTPELKKLNAWLGRINSNLNMLAHHANKYKGAGNLIMIDAHLNDISADVEKVRKFALSLKVNSK